MHLSHSHCDHQHHAAPMRLDRSFAVAVILNVLLVIGEAIGGWWSGSIALLADAGHNLGDVAGLLLAWGAHWLRGRAPAGRWTYGWRAFTMMAANLNGLLLIVAIVGVSIESVRRLFVPSEIAEIPVILVASFAAVLNFGTAWLLASHSKHDLNVRGAYLHMLADAAVSVAVVLGAVAIIFTGWFWLDAAISLGICVVLAIGTWHLLRESMSMLMHAAPTGIMPTEIKSSLLSHPEVQRVEDVHVWSVSTTEVLLTAKLGCGELRWEQQAGLLQRIHEGLEHDFGIRHATLELVPATELHEACALDNKLSNILT